MSTTVSPNMNLVIPGSGSEPGPAYSLEINNDLATLIDQHDHSSGKGVLIGVNGLNINADFPIGNNNINNARSYRAHNNGAILTGGADICCLNVVGGDLYYNNASGTAIKITNAASINSTNTFYSPKAISANATILASDNFVYYGVDSTTGAVTINLPSASLVTNGRFYFFKDVKGTALTNNIILAANGSDKIDGVSSKLLDTNYLSCMLECDGNSTWRISYFSDPQWLLGTFGRTGVTLTLIGSIVNLTAVGTGSVNIGAATNALTFAGSSYTFGYVAGNNLTINAAQTIIHGTSLIVDSTSGSSFGTFVNFSGTYVSLSATTQLLAAGNATLGTNSSNTLSVNSTSTFHAGIAAVGATFSSDVTIGGITTLNGTTNVNGDTVVNAVVTFNGITDFHNDAYFRVGHTTTFAGSITIDGAVDLQGTIGTSTGYIAGRKVARILRNLGTGNTTDYAPFAIGSGTGYDFVWITTTGGPYTWQLPTSASYVAGDSITFATFATSCALIIQDPGGATIATLSGAGTITDPTNSVATVMYTGVSWHRIA